VSWRNLQATMEAFNTVSRRTPISRSFAQGEVSDAEKALVEQGRSRPAVTLTGVQAPQVVFRRQNRRMRRVGHPAKPGIIYQTNGPETSEVAAPSNLASCGERAARRRGSSFTLRYDNIGDQVDRQT